MGTTFDPSLYGAPSLAKTIRIYMRWPPMCAIDLYVRAANIYAMASYICDGRKYINCHKYAMAEYACDDRKGYTSSGRRRALQLH